MMKKWDWLLVVFLVSGCGQKPVADVKVTDTEAIRPSEAAESTMDGIEIADDLGQIKEGPSPTPRSTRTPKPTEFPKIEIAVPPDQTPLAEQDEEGFYNEGPWFVMYTSEMVEVGYVWAMNWDGTGFRELLKVDDLFGIEIRVFPAPRGGRMMFSTSSFDFSSPPDLYMVQFPNGQPRMITPLILDEFHVDAFVDTIEAYYDYWQTYLTTVRTGAWSHSGNYFAFSGVLDAPSSDLYVFDVYENEISRLTDGPSLAYKAYWSPDDRYIVHYGVSSLNHGASGGGYSDNVIWAVDRATDQVELVQVGADYGIENLIAWIDNKTYLADTWEHPYGYSNLRLVHLDRREDEVIFCDYYQNRAYDPATQTIAFYVTGYWKSDMDCGSETGIYYYSLVSGELKRVADYPGDEKEPFQYYFELENYPEFGGFHFYNRDEDKVIGVDYQGELMDGWVDEPRLYSFAPNGIDYFFRGDLYFEGKWYRMPFGFVIGTPVWRSDGKAFIGLAFYPKNSNNLNIFYFEAPDFEPVLIYTFPEEVWETFRYGQLEFEWVEP